MAEDRKKFRVAVAELLRKVVVVEARDEEEAYLRVCDAWQNGEYILDGRDFDGAEFHVLGEFDVLEAESYSRAVTIAEHDVCRRIGDNPQ